MYSVTPCQMTTADSLLNNFGVYVVLPPVVPSAFPPPFSPLLHALQAPTWDEMSET